MKVAFPCKDCTERVLGCHGTCEKYAQARKGVREEKAARWKAHEVDSYRRFTSVKFKIYRIKEAAKH